jgi:hypothetical protein
MVSTQDLLLPLLTLPEVRRKRRLPIYGVRATTTLPLGRLKKTFQGSGLVREIRRA